MWAEASMEIRTTRKSCFLYRVLAWIPEGQGFCCSEWAISRIRSNCARSAVMLPSSPEPGIGMGLLLLAINMTLLPIYLRFSAVVQFRRDEEVIPMLSDSPRRA